jgi:hypothetical protein
VPDGGPVTESTVGLTPSTTIVVGETALFAVLPRDVESVNAGNVAVALFPALSLIVPETILNEVVPTYWSFGVLFPDATVYVNSKVSEGKPTVCGFDV